jgi:uncharacterized membrane protein
MAPTWLLMLCGFSIIGCALVAGVLLTFSDFVMRSLNGARTAAGIEVMQLINREVFKTVFMTLAAGLLLMSPVLMGYAYVNLVGPAATLIIAGGTLYVAGVAVTLVFNVPMNDRLARLESSGTDGAAYWTNTYFPRWTFWNWVRVICCAAAAGCYLIASLWLVQVR